MLVVLFTAVIIIRIIIAAIQETGKPKRQKQNVAGITKRRYAMRKTVFKRRIKNRGQLFNGHFVDVKAFYAAYFKRVPCVSFIGEIDISNAYAAIKDCCAEDILETYQHSYYDHNEKQTFFNNTIIVLRKERMIEISGNYCQLLHTPGGYDWSRWLMKKLAVFRTPSNSPQPTANTRILGFAGAEELN
ncbi:MAG TPA: hypothetical protein VG738_16685 [Chitinophagaceae bacterium]|nr:hypothetical protein [Chitinophagaceae bacterium]